MKKLAGIFAIAATLAALPHLVQAQLTPGGNLPIGSSTGQFVSTQPSTTNLQPCTNNTALAACAAILNGTATITARLPEQWDASFFPVTYTSANGATDRVDIQPAATITTIGAYTISGQFTVDAALQACCMAATPSAQMRFAVNWTGGVAREDSITFNPISGALVTSANVVRFSVTPFTAVASGDGGTNSQIPIRVFTYSFTVPVVPAGTAAGTLRVYPCTATATCAGQVVGGAFQIEAASTNGLNATAFIATPPNGSRGRLNGLAPRQSVDRTIPTQTVTGAYTYQQGIDNGTNLDVTVAAQTITLPALNATLPAPLQTDGEWVKITNDNTGNTTISSSVSKIFGPGLSATGVASISLPFSGTGTNNPVESVTLVYNAKASANGEWVILDSNQASNALTPGGSTCAFDAAGLESCAVGTNTPAAGSFTTGAFSGAVTSTKACATNYARISPNYCINKTIDPDANLTTLGATCTTVTAPANATAVILQVQLSDGSTGVNETLEAHTSGTCVSRIAHLIVPSAVTGGSNITQMLVPVISGNFFLLRGGGGTPTVQFYVIGYYD